MPTINFFLLFAYTHARPPNSAIQNNQRCFGFFLSMIIIPIRKQNKMNCRIHASQEIQSSVCWFFCYSLILMIILQKLQTQTHGLTVLSNDFAKKKKRRRRKRTSKSSESVETRNILWQIAPKCLSNMQISQCERNDFLSFFFDF